MIWKRGFCFLQFERVGGHLLFHMEALSSPARAPADLEAKTTGVDSLVPPPLPLRELMKLVLYLELRFPVLAKATKFRMTTRKICP